MSQFEQYPRVMNHPQHKPAIIVKWDPKLKPDEQKKGAPERFPPVVVRNFDQEQEYAAKGYVPSGKSDPEAYRKAMTGNENKPDNQYVAYPKWLYRLATKAGSDDDVESVLVKTEAEELALDGKWYGNPDMARAAPPEVKTKKPTVLLTHTAAGRDEEGAAQDAAEEAARPKKKAKKKKAKRKAKKALRSPYAQPEA